MVFLQRSTGSAHWKRPLSSPPSPCVQPGPLTPSDPHVDTMLALLAEAGCTLRLPPGAPPCIPSEDPHRIRRHLDRRLGAEPDLVVSFVSGFGAYIQSQSDLHRVLIPASQDNKSLAKILLSVPSIQPQILQTLLQKLPEHFADLSPPSLSLQDDISRLIINQFRWLDFLVNPKEFTEILMEVLSIAPCRLKREIVGLLPEILGDESHELVVPALERMLSEDSELVVPVLDSLSDLNLDEQLQEQAVTIAISCLRTVDQENMPHLLRFLLLAATQENVRRIILQIRDHLKFSVPIDSNALRNKKLKGKCIINSTDVAILEALKSSLRFKNMICEAILKELKSIDKPQNHKSIDIWFLILIYANGGLLQKSCEKMIKKKIIQGSFHEALFYQCINGHKELVKDHFSTFLSISEYLLACKEDKCRAFAIHLFRVLFEEFKDIYSRQEILGGLVTHIGSGVDHEVSSALNTVLNLTTKHSEELIPISSHINGILDYLESFNEDNLRKVYDIFCHLALCDRANKDSSGSKIGNELLMIVRKQVSNPDMKYKKMGIIGTLRVVCKLGDINSSVNNFSSSQKSHSDEALELLKMSINSCKTEGLALILLYDELSALLERNSLQPTILDWVGVHAGEFEVQFVADLEEGQLTTKNLSDGIEGELWMNLDGDLAPICLNILPLVSSSFQENSSLLRVLPSQFTLLSVIEKLTNQGSLGGIDALIGCPLHLPSPKCLDGENWRKMSEKQKQIVCFSFYYAINWIRELVNAFSTQVGTVDFVTQKTKNDMAMKLLKRLRNLILLEGLLNGILETISLSLPELIYSPNKPNSSIQTKLLNTYSNPKKRGRKPKSENHKEKEESNNKANPDGKNLKQPTILDAFKRAGVSVSQDSPNGSSPAVQSSEFHASEIGLVDLALVPVHLELQRCNFRPLMPVSLSLLAFSESGQSDRQGENIELCCSDSQAELPIYLYILRDLNSKLDSTDCEILMSIRPLFGYLRRHLDNAFSMLRDGFENCSDHWADSSSSDANPVLPFVTVSKPNIANSVFREILCCYRKLLSIQEFFSHANLPILKELLEAFQTSEKLEESFSEIKPSLINGNLDYLYAGAYMFFECIIIDDACSHSYLLASEILETMQSVVSSVSTLIEKLLEENENNLDLEGSKKTIPFLKKRLGVSAHKLLSNDLNNSEDSIIGCPNKNELVQKILRIYLRNSESTSDLLDQLACSVLPQVSSCKTKGSQETNHEFQTLSPSMFLTWYRSLHEENCGTLARLVKEVIPKLKANSNLENINSLLEELDKLVRVLVSLVNMCRVHDKVAVHALAVKYGGKFIDTFLKVFGFLKVQFEHHSNKIINMMKELQKATRLIQTICSEAKGSKKTMITTKIPYTKRSLERFLFEVKALIHNTTGRTFTLGVLKHKDLSGQVVSSQVYSHAETENDQDNQDENDQNNQDDNDQDNQDDVMIHEDDTNTETDAEKIDEMSEQF